MKKRIWTALPIYLIFVVAMLMMALLSYSYNKVIFIFNICTCVVTLIVTLIMLLRFRNYVRNVVSSAMKTVSDVSQEHLDSLKIATAVLGEYGEILMYNSRFEKIFFRHDDALCDNIRDFIKGESVESLCMSESGVDVEFSEKKLTI